MISSKPFSSMTNGIFILNCVVTRCIILFLNQTKRGTSLRGTLRDLTTNYTYYSIVLRPEFFNATKIRRERFEFRNLHLI